jgi:tetratricopeptide (TPR) repeat protein
MEIQVVRGRFLLLTLCAATIGLTSAHAQPQSPGPENNSISKETGVARYLEGERHYAAGRYELAVQEFEAALELSGKASLHFNIANCHERAGNYIKAAESLETFLTSENPPEPEILRERVWRLKRRARERQERLENLVEKRVVEKRAEERQANEKRAEEERAAATAQELVAGPDVTQPEIGPRQSLLPSYLTMAAGGTALAAGIAFAALSRRSGNKAEAACAQQLCTRDAESSLSKQRWYARAADLSGVIGLATVGVGGYLWYRTREREKTGVRAMPLVGPGTVGIAASARF